MEKSNRFSSTEHLAIDLAPVVEWLVNLLIKLEPTSDCFYVGNLKHTVEMDHGFSNVFYEDTACAAKTVVRQVLYCSDIQLFTRASNNGIGNAPPPSTTS